MLQFSKSVSGCHSRAPVRVNRESRISRINNKFLFYILVLDPQFTDEYISAWG